MYDACGIEAWVGSVGGKSEREAGGYEAVEGGVQRSG